MLIVENLSNLHFVPEPHPNFQNAEWAPYFLFSVALQIFLRYAHMSRFF